MITPTVGSIELQKFSSSLNQKLIVQNRALFPGVFLFTKYTEKVIPCLFMASAHLKCAIP